MAICGGDQPSVAWLGWLPSSTFFVAVVVVIVVVGSSGAQGDYDNRSFDSIPRPVWPGVWPGLAGFSRTPGGTD